MGMRYLIWSLLTGLMLLGCSSKVTEKQKKLWIIKLTVDSVLKLDSGLNTPNYWIAFSKVHFFDKTDIHEYLKSHPNFTQINSDSLIKNDSIWTKSGSLRKVLIEFKRVEIKGDSIIIDLDKIRAIEGATGIEIILKEDKNGYKVVSSKITWIS